MSSKAMLLLQAHGTYTSLPFRNLRDDLVVRRLELTPIEEMEGRGRFR
jgi:hypothetical protein